MAFEKITENSLVNKGVTGLPDVPGLTTTEMQAKFDELSRDVIIPKLNEIVDGLNGDEVGLSSQIENPETKEKDVIQNVVNAIYQVVKENSDKRHDHENKETLDKVTSELYESITELVSMFNGISAVDKTVTADDTKIPTSGAIVNYVTELGAGDMQKAVYDKDNTGIVDDAKKLGGVAPEEYLQKASLPDATVAFEVAETRSNISTGEKVSAVFGKIKKFFADLTAPAFAQMITTKEDLLATKVTGYVPDAKAVADTYTELNGKLGNFYLLYSHLCGTDGNSIWRQNPQFPEEYYAQYTVPEKEGYRFFFSFWQISWTNNNEYSNYLIRNPFLHEKNGNIEVYSKDGTPTFVPVFLCIYLPV